MNFKLLLHFHQEDNGGDKVFKYFYKVSWCPICSQGWVEIVKDTVTNELSLICSECENEWDNPIGISDNNAKEEISDNFVTEPTMEEVKKKNWDKYMLRK